MSKMSEQLARKYLKTHLKWQWAVTCYHTLFSSASPYDSFWKHGCSPSTDTKSPSARMQARREGEAVGLGTSWGGGMQGSVAQHVPEMVPSAFALR